MTAQGTAALLDVLAEVAPPGLVGCMRALDVAATLVSSDDPEGAFGWLTPPTAMLKADLAVYRSHCTELLERLRDGASRSVMLRMTRAEAMLCMSVTSLAAPLSPLGMRVYQRLFVDVFGEVAHTILGHIMPDHDPDQLDEEISALLRRASTRLAPEGPP